LMCNINIQGVATSTSNVHINVIKIDPTLKRSVPVVENVNPIKSSLVVHCSNLFISCS